MTAKKLGDYTILELDRFISYVNRDKEYASFYVNDGHVILKVGNATIKADDQFDMGFWKEKSTSDKLGKDVRDLVCSMIGSIHKGDYIIFITAMSGSKYYIQVTQSYPFYGKKASYMYTIKDDYVMSQFRKKGFNTDYMYKAEDIFNF